MPVMSAYVCAQRIRLLQSDGISGLIYVDCWLQDPVGFSMCIFFLNLCDYVEKYR